MLNKAAQHLHKLSKFYHRVYFSSSKSDKDTEVHKKLKLSPIKQRALISYYTLQYIMLFQKSNFRTSSDSIRQSLLNKKEFISFIKSRQKTKSNLILDEQYIDEVFEGFTIGKGFLYNRKVFSQNRFNLAESVLNPLLENSKVLTDNNCEVVQQTDVPRQQIITEKKFRQTDSKLGRIVLNPLSYTGTIIYNILNRNSKMICGEKGTGKSFAFLIYIYCTNYIVQLRNSDEYKQQSQHFFKYVDQKSFEDIPKLSYIALKEHTSFEKITQVLRQQNQPVDLSQIENKFKEKYNDPYILKLQLFKQYIKKTLEKDGKKNRFKGCVVDEANHYYQQIRIYLKNRQSYTGMTITDQDRFRIKKDARQKAVWLTDVLSAICTNFLPRILNSSQNVEKKYVKDINNKNKQSFFDFFSHDDSKQMQTHIQFKPYLQTKEGQVELYGIMWFQIEVMLNHYQFDQQIIKSYRKIFNQSFNLPPSQHAPKASNQRQQSQDIQYWKKDVRFFNIRNIVKSKNKKELVSIFEKNTLQELRKEIQSDRQQKFKEQFSKFFNKGLNIEELQRHRFLYYIRQQVQKLLINPSTKYLQKTEIMIGQSQVFSKSFIDELRQSLDISVEKLSLNLMNCVFNQSPFWVRDQVMNSLQDLLNVSVNFMKILLQKKEMNSSAVGQILQSIAHFFIYPANVILKLNKFDSQGKKQQLVFDIVKTSYILNEENGNIKKSLANLVSNAQDKPLNYVAGIPTVSNHPFFDFAIARYSPATLQDKKKLELWLIDYGCGDLKDKATDKYDGVGQFVKKFDGAYQDYDLQVNFFLASLDDLAEVYALQMMDVALRKIKMKKQNKTTRTQKNNIFTIKDEKQPIFDNNKIRFSFEVMGIPSLDTFINFKANQYIYPIKREKIGQFIRQAQQFFNAFVKSKNQKK